MEALSTQTITLPRTLPAGQIVAMNISEDTYMTHYAGDSHEWIEGVVIKMSPISFQHDKLTAYLRLLFEAYLALRPVGIVLGDPFVMRLEFETETGRKATRREPDLQIILNENRDIVTDTFTDGPADICIEVISPGTESTDYGEKLSEYEKGGVGEYWIIDPARQQSYFHRLADGEVYKLHLPDEHGHYTTPKLPDFRLHVPTLWQSPLPSLYDVAESVKAMLT